MQYSCGIIYLLFSLEVHFMDKKIAVLTGGTSGIGMQTALALKSAGYTFMNSAAVRRVSRDSTTSSPM